MEMKREQVLGLIEILLDHNARLDERDDAAMDLYATDEPEALEALIKIASNSDEDLLLLTSSGESIGEILIRKQNLDTMILKKMQKQALAEALAIIKEKKPNWFYAYKLKGLQIKND